MKFVVVCVVLCVTGCGTTASVPREIRDARAAVRNAGVAAELDPSDVRAARAELADAESTYRRLGDVAEARDLATVAARRARLAESRASERVENACPAGAVTLTSAQVSSPRASSLALGASPDFVAIDRFVHALPTGARVTIEIPATLEARDLAEGVRAHLGTDGIAPANVTIAESAATTKPRLVVANAPSNQ